MHLLCGYPFLPVTYVSWLSYEYSAIQPKRFVSRINNERGVSLAGSIPMDRGKWYRPDRHRYIPVIGHMHAGRCNNQYTFSKQGKDGQRACVQLHGLWDVE